jgi:hypothetical protein
LVLRRLTYRQTWNYILLDEVVDQGRCDQLSTEMKSNVKVEWVGMHTRLVGQDNLDIDTVIMYRSRLTTEERKEFDLLSPAMKSMIRFCWKYS